MLFLRPAIIHILKRELREIRYLDRIFASFSQCGRLGIHAERSTVTALPQTVREEAYARVRSIAKRHDIAVRICACKNPDISQGSCRITGRRSNNEQQHREQPVLF